MLKQRFKIRRDDLLHAVKPGILHQVAHVLFFSRLRKVSSQRVDGNIQSVLVAEFETIGDGLFGGVDH